METAAKTRLAIPNDLSRAPRAADAGPLFVVAGDKARLASSLVPDHQIPPENSSFLTLLQSAESRIRQLRSARSLERRSCAEEVVALIREIVRFEREAASFDVALPSFVDDLWAETHIRDLLLALYRDARTMLHPRLPLAVEQSYDCAQQIALLDYFVDWFSRRRSALYNYAEHPLCDAGDVLISGIEHDQEFLGERGCHVLVSLRVDGLEFQTLWLQAILFCEEKAVEVRRGWHFWENDPELFASLGGAEARISAGGFASVIPVVPVDQRAIYEQIKLFIPYAALNLPPQSRQQIDFEVSLLASNGRVLGSDACSEAIALPDGIDNRPIPSPAALGFWPQNVGRGDRLSIERVSLERRFEVRREMYSLEIDYDLCCISRQKESLSLEIRVLTIEGNLVESSLAAFSAKDGSFIYRRTLTPDKIVSLYPSSRCSIPLVALELDPGTHDMLVEMTLIGADNRVICGAVERARFEMPEVPTMGCEHGDSGQPAIEQALDSALFISSVEIDPEHRFNMRDCLKVEVSFFDSDPRDEDSQLRIVLETGEQGSFRRTPLMRALRLARSKEVGEFSQLFVFDSEEVLSLFPGHHATSALAITIEVINSRREIILSTRRECVVPPRFGKERNVHTALASPPGEVEIVDAVMRRTPNRGGECLIDLVLNFELTHMERGDYLIYGEPIIPGKTSSSEPNPAGCMVELTPPVSRSSVVGLSLVQERRVVRLPSAQSALVSKGAKLMLFSPAGRLMQVVYQRIGQSHEPAGVPFP